MAATAAVAEQETSVASQPQAWASAHLRELEAESIYIFREVAASFANPVLMYSIGKDSSVLLHLAKKAFFPGRIPFPLLHVDTGLKFREMYTFRDQVAASLDARLIVHTNKAAVNDGARPWTLGTVRCCALLKTQALLDALREGGFDAAIGGARREEERSRAKERVFSFRDIHGQWDPKHQRPELWNLYNTRHEKGDSFRVFPLSNWTEMDIWQYIYRERIPISPLYFAKERPVVRRNGQLIPLDGPMPLNEGEKAETVKCRFRTLGCFPCTGAVPSNAETLEQILEELIAARNSERITRVIDHDVDASMEEKKKEGYF
jgi:sulfate adenylyltransferase subunit 2